MTRPSKDSALVECEVLNRLLLACRAEGVTLHRAAGELRDERGAALRRQAERRRIFGGDLGAAIVALGGTPRTSLPLHARLSRAIRDLRARLTEPGQESAYAACFRATDRTARAYEKALCLELAGDTRFGIENQYQEIAFDLAELRWLRWGGSMSRFRSRVRPSSEPMGRAVPDSDRADARALESWGEDGGRADDGDLEARAMRYADRRSSNERQHS